MQTSTVVTYFYDGTGQRVAMQSTVSGTVTTTAYIGTIEEVQTSGSTTQTTTYYTLGGKRVAASVNGTIYYFGYDALGSQVAVLSTSGSVVGTQLYSPYGSKRYSTGVLPTSIGFTGQRADSVTGLDYYNARYYDPVVGRFVSVDMVQGNGQGMDPYGYVGGNPESRTDPTGKRFVFATAGEDYSTSGISGLYSAGGGTIVSSYVPPPYTVQIRNNQPMTTPTTSGNTSKGENPKIAKPAPTPTLKPSKPKTTPTQKQIAAGQQAASQAAFDAASGFRTLSNWLWVLSGLTGIAALANWWNPVLCGILASLTAAFIELAANAGEISGRFSDENNHGLGWFTKANLASAEQSMATYLFETGLTGIAASGGLIGSALAAIKTAAQVVGKAAQVTIVAGITLEVTEVVGNEAMMYAASRITSDQESEVLT